MKISDHHVRSPVLNINRACQTCHKFPEDEQKARVELIQDRTYQLRNIALDSVVQLTRDIGTLVRSDSGDASARQFQRRAQFLGDFIEAENSMGFHAPQEAARVLAHALHYARQGQRVLAGQSNAPVPRTRQTMKR